MNTAAIEQRLQALEDIEAIRALKARYLASCDGKDPAAIRACFADGPVEIDYGAVGRFDNADALVAVYTQIACHPHMVEIHHGSNPQIEVQGPDAASATWSLQYGLINTREKNLTQLAGYYEDGYRKIDGAWKIVRTRFVATSTLALDLDGSQVQVLFAGRTPPAAA